MAFNTTKVQKNLNKTISNSTPDDIRSIKKRGKMFVPLMLMIPALIFFALFTFIPLIKIIIDSLHNKNDNYSSTFAVIWTDDTWFIAIFNSLLYAILSVPITLAVALLISFTLSNIIRKKFREFWQTIFFIPYVTSTVAISIVFAQLFSSQDYGIINWILGTHLGWLESTYDTSPVAIVPILIFGVWHSLAFKVLILTSAMLTIDKRLYDAASIDGASKKDMFFNITLPALNSTVWYLITIGLIGSLKVFPLALFNNNYNDAMERFPTMLTYVYSLVQASKYEQAGAASISLIAVIIVFNWIIRKGIYGIEGYFSNRKENQVKNEIRSYEAALQKGQKYDEKQTNVILETADKHLKGGGK